MENISKGKNPQNKIKIGLLTPYSGGNLGDGAILEAVIHNLKNRIPNVLIFGITLFPEDTEIRHRILSFPISSYSNKYYTLFKLKNDKHTDSKEKKHLWLFSNLKIKVKNSKLAYRFLKPAHDIISQSLNEFLHINRALRFSRKLDILIVSGGGQLDEYWGGPWGHPYVLFKWALIGKVVKTKFVIMSVGLSTVDSLLGKIFINWTLKLSSYRSYRDDVSKKRLSKLLFTKNDRVFPDLVFSYPIKDLLKKKKTKKGPIIVGISPIAYCDSEVWPRQDEIVYGVYVRKLASFVSWLLGRGYQVLFFATDSPDRKTIKDIMLNLNFMGIYDFEANILNPKISTVGELFFNLSEVDFVIASRLHAVKISHMLHKPTIGISYEKKVNTYMASVNHSDYCVDIENFDIDSLISRFNRLQSEQSESDKLVIGLREKMENFSASLERQYGHVLSFLTGI